MLSNIAILLCFAFYTTFASPTIHRQSTIEKVSPFSHTPFKPYKPSPFDPHPRPSPFNPNPHIEPFKPLIRLRRTPFTEGERQYGQNQNGGNQNQKTWEVRPDLSRDQRGNTRGKVEVQRHGENHEINAGYEQIFRGPDKHSESWHVGGSFGW